VFCFKLKKGQAEGFVLVVLLIIGLLVSFSLGSKILSDVDNTLVGEGKNATRSAGQFLQVFSNGIFRIVGLLIGFVFIIYLFRTLSRF